MMTFESTQILRELKAALLALLKPQSMAVRVKQQLWIVRFSPRDAVPSCWPLCQCASSLCGMLQTWEWSGVGPSTSWCVSYHLVCGNQSVGTEHLAMCVATFVCSSCHNLVFYKYSTCSYFFFMSTRAPWWAISMNLWTFELLIYHSICTDTYYTQVFWRKNWLLWFIHA